MKPVPLKYPIKVGSIELNELSFCRPNLGILADAAEGDRGELHQLIEIIAKTATCPSQPDIPMTVALARKIDPEDLPALGEVINGFFPNGLPTGGSA